MFLIVSPLVELFAAAATASHDLVLRFLSHVIIITWITVCVSSDHATQTGAGAGVVHTPSSALTKHILSSAGLSINLR